MGEHRVIMSKMKKASPLLAHPMLTRHVPETVWYQPENLRIMLAKYPVLYLKPDTGCQGRGIVRLDRREQGVLELRQQGSSNLINADKVIPALKPVMDVKKKYIVQQGIELATYNNCPFDIRMVMQKPYSTWQLTLTSAKVALKDDAIVTNVARGAQDYPLLEIIFNYDQMREPLATYRELIDLAHQGATLLGSALPFRVIGFDMALDKSGKVWFLEANTNPQCAQAKLVNDQFTVEKFEAAQTIIGRIGRSRSRKPGIKKTLR